MIGRKSGHQHITKSDKHMQNENQQEFWQDNRTFLYCFYSEKDFRFSGMLDQILGPVYFRKLTQGRFHASFV